MSEGSSPSGEIEHRSVQDLVSSVERCKGHYSFLIGAGTSLEAGIPTAGQLISKWKSERFSIERPEIELDETSEEEINEWAREVEDDKIKQGKHDYGFWFEKQYTTRGERRQFIREMVKNKEPTFGHIVLASLMNDGYIPLTLTPNFDDLLYDAFYLFLEQKPMMIDHNAIAPEFRLTQERPSIIKLHGDYLYDNLKNTTSETEKLENNIQKALSRSLDEYGMIVVGYGGKDESIMNVINSENVGIPDYGLFWCALSESNLSDEAKELLREPNTYLVEIDGFEELLTSLFSDIDDVSVPMPDQINSRAKEREQVLREKVANAKGTGPLDLFMSAQNYTQDDEFRNAIELLTTVIEDCDEDELHAGGLSLSDLYSQRAMNHLRLGKYERGIDDYTTAIEFDESPVEYLNRAEAKVLANKPDEALEDIMKSREVGGDKREDVSLLLEIVSKVVSGEPYEKKEKELRNLDSSGLLSTWEYQTLRNGLEISDIDQEKQEKIIELIDGNKSKEIQSLNQVSLSKISES